MDWSRLPLSRVAADRAAERRSEPDVIERSLADPKTRVVLVHGHQLATVDGVSLDLITGAEVPRGGSGLVAFLGVDDEGDWLAVEVPQTDDPAWAAVLAGRTWTGLRECGYRLSDRDAGLAATAVGLVAWHERHPRCPLCGARTEPVLAGWVRRCTEDGTDHYPRTDPAVIMAVVDDADRILLGRGATWSEGRFSTLAGYLEPGESAEHAVMREVAEEVNLKVVDPVYRGSQPWPFPASLMLAFTARAITTDVQVDGAEVAEAHWFSRDELAAAISEGRVVLPTRTSVARALIEDWYGGLLEGGDAPR